MNVTGETFQATATEQLRGMKKLSKRYQAADLSGAVVCAAKCAAEHGKDVFVVSSNSFGNFVWAVTLDRRDVTSLVVNSGKRAFRVSPDRSIFKLTIEA